MQDERIWPSDELAVARRVVQVHAQGWQCVHCTPDGCRVMEWAMPVVFDATAGANPGPKTLEDVERIAREIRGDED